jgi:DNA processing protein
VRPAPDEPPAQHPTEPALFDPERWLPGQFDDYPIGVDELSAGTGLTASQATAALSVLELKRLVRRLPGHQFVRA